MAARTIWLSGGPEFISRILNGPGNGLLRNGFSYSQDLQADERFRFMAVRRVFEDIATVRKTRTALIRFQTLTNVIDLIRFSLTNV